MAVFYTGLFEFIKKQASACFFGIALLSLMLFSQQYFFLIEKHVSFYRLDLLLFCALFIQCWLLFTKRETWEEFQVIILFHLLAFVMEVFKVHVGSWVYPEQAIFSIAGVPLFAGFMYSAVGSYIARNHQLFNISYINFPNVNLAVILVVGIYANFFLHHYWYDLRLFLLVMSVVLFYKTRAILHLNNKAFTLPMLPIFLAIACFLWVAENIATYTNVWRYPNQMQVWQFVSYSKILAWYLLMLLSFVLVALVSFNKKKNS